MRLVALAALVCAIAALTAVILLKQITRSRTTERDVWLAVTAVVTGFGTWTTHFIAMLAFQPGLPSGYDVALTLVSLVAAIGLTGIGLRIGLGIGLMRPSFTRWLAGVVIGGGIATMHYTGMAAFETTGHIVWDVPLVAASLVLGCVLAGAALHATLGSDTLRSRALGALLLTLAICSHHFTAMGAATIVPDPSIVVSAAALPAGTMSIGVAFVSLAIVALAFAGLTIERRRKSSETARMRELADAAIEGLIVCDADRIVAANRSFATLAGADGHELDGVPLESFLPSITTGGAEGAALTPIEATLRTVDGRTIPVELIRRNFVYQGKPHQVLAVRDIRRRKQAEEDIRFLAHHDPLTRLPNRASFNKRLEAELAAHHGTERCFAVLFLDLDRFKEINDLFGHAAGDAVLQFVADKVTGVLAPGQVLARLGGDEFAIIVTGLAEPEDVEHTATAVLAAIREPDGRLPAEIGVGASIGAAVFPRDATDRATLLTHADAALYEAKAEGRGVWRMFEPSMGAELRERREMQQDVRHAIARGELSLVYQPQADVRSGDVTGFEALLRWSHPTRGMISPGVFIPLAEECGAILQIGEWVLRTACATAATWAQPLSVAVNVSAVQLHNGNLPELVAELLDETGLEPSRLELEVTETALVKDLGRAVANIRRLKALGVKIAMDDFGTGYSSLSNLRAFPFDKIKIDRSFVRAVDKNAEASAIVRAVLGLARGLNLPVTAEGVETSGELWFLQLLECDSIQGYLLGRPGPISDFEEFTHGQRVVHLDESKPRVAARHRSVRAETGAAISA